MSTPFQAGITRVYLAGLHGSEPGHWQSRWHAQDPGSVWVQHQDWEHPDLGALLADVDAALAGRKGPKLLVAHSLGCYLAAAWASILRPQGLLGAFLVAPPDLSHPGLAGVARGFEAGSSLPLACHGALMASQDDPWAGFEHSRGLASRWHLQLIDAGAVGHINLASGLGGWPQGQAELAAFQAAFCVPSRSAA